MVVEVNEGGVVTKGRENPTLENHVFGDATVGHLLITEAVAPSGTARASRWRTSNTSSRHESSSVATSVQFSTHLRILILESYC